MKIQFLEPYLILISALLLASAFIIPIITAPFILFFLMPLYVLKKKFITFKYGFLWGLLFYSLYFHGIFFLVLDYASGMFKIPLFFIFLFYCASTSGCWFVITSVLLNLFKNFYTETKQLTAVFCWTLSALIYFLYIHYIFFLPLGALLGNKLNNPLIIGAHFLYLFLSHSWYITQLFFFFGLQATLFLTLSCLQYGILFLLFVVPYGYTWLFLPSKEQQLLNECTFIACVPYKNDRTSWQQATSFAQCIEQLSEVHKKLIIITPEAAFSCALNYYEEFYQEWFNNDKDYALIVGAYRGEGDTYYNSLYVLHQRRITHIYDKKIRMPLIEYIPSCYYASKTVQNLFLKNAVCVTSGTNTRNPITIHGSSFTPCICSEFFFDSFNIHHNTSLIVIINDSWFKTPYIQNLFLLYAQYQALLLSKTIIYVGYQQQYIINQRGQKKEIRCYKY